MNSGETDRLMKTVSLFLGMVKLVNQYSDLKLPFTYDYFFNMAVDKINFQLSLIRSTDKLAMFFYAINTMIDTKNIVMGRDLSIEQPRNVTYKDLQGNKCNYSNTPGAHVVFIRLGNVFSIYSKNGYNDENSSLSTIEQNLRSHPSYIGLSSSHRFSWEETVEEASAKDQETMVRVRKTRNTITSAIVMNYDRLMEDYGIDFRRDENPAEEGQQTPDVKQESSECVPGSIPFSETDAGGKANTPF